MVPEIPLKIGNCQNDMAASLDKILPYHLWTGLQTSRLMILKNFSLFNCPILHCKVFFGFKMSNQKLKGTILPIHLSINSYPALLRGATREFLRGATQIRQYTELIYCV